MNIAIILEKFSHVKIISEYFNASITSNKYRDFVGCVYEATNRYFFVHSIGCMHTLNTMHYLHSKYAINTFVRVGSCGIKKGSDLLLENIILMDKAINLDAISERYLPSAKPYASEKLKKIFIPRIKPKINSCYTIDVVWQDVENQNAVVDMETSAIYAFAYNKNIDALSLSIVRDDETSRITVERQAELIKDLCIETISILENLK